MINLKEFKQSVLQKAMQGKLTKQLPSDGNASDLLVKIANKKRDLYQAGELKKSEAKPLPPITDKEKPSFKIPDNWEWTKLGNVCKLINGRAYKKKELLNDNSLTPVLRVGNLFTDKAWYYSNLKLPAKNYVHYGDLIYSWSASFGPRIWKGPTAIFHYHIWKVNFFSQYLYELYLFYVLLNATHLAKLQSHGTSMKHITMYRMNRIPVPIPPLSEQKRIVAKVHKCFELADTIQKERELNKKFAHDMKQSLLMEAMQGNLTKQLPSDGTADELLQKIQQKKQELIIAGKIRRHKKLPPISKDEIPSNFNIPKNWKWVRLANISKILMGQSPRKGTVSKGHADNCHFEFHQGKSLFGYLFLKKSNKVTTSKSKIVKPNTVVMSVRAPVGNVNITPRIIAIGRGLCGISPYINLDYVYWFLFSQKHELQNRSTGTTFKAINKTNIKQFLCPLPPLSEQERIVNKLHELFIKL